MLFPYNIPSVFHQGFDYYYNRHLQPIPGRNSHSPSEETVPHPRSVKELSLHTQWEQTLQATIRQATSTCMICTAIVFTTNSIYTIHLASNPLRSSMLAASWRPVAVVVVIVVVFIVVLTP